MTDTTTNYYREESLPLPGGTVFAIQHGAVATSQVWFKEAPRILFVRKHGDFAEALRCARHVHDFAWGLA